MTEVGTATKSNNALIDGILTGFKINQKTFKIAILPDALLETVNTAIHGSNYQGKAITNTEITGIVMQIVETISGVISNVCGLNVGVTTNIYEADVYITPATGLSVAKDGVLREVGGITYPPDSQGKGVVIINTDRIAGSSDVVNTVYTSIIHEVLHSIGLTHPFDGLVPWANFDTIGDNERDNVRYTTLSYESSGINSEILKNVGHAVNLSPIDVAALQYLYPQTASSNGSSDYTLTDDMYYFRTIYNASNSSTIRYDGQYSVTLNINSATLGNSYLYDKLLAQWEFIPQSVKDSFYADTLGRPGYFVWEMQNTHFDGGALSSVNLRNEPAGGFLIAKGANVANAYGGSGDDLIIGNAGNNSLNGGGGNDIIIGSGGTDIVDGGSGNDFILIGPSSAVSHSTVDGGTGTDTVSFALLDQGTSAPILRLKVDLNLGYASGVSGWEPTLVNIENVIGSRYADFIIGTAQNNRLEGGDGNDTFNGKGGSDVIDGGAGSDTVVMNGDWADYTFTKSQDTDGREQITGTLKAGGETVVAYDVEAYSFTKDGKPYTMTKEQVLNQAPTSVTIKHSSVINQTIMSSAMVGTLTAVDANAHDVLSYSIADASSDRYEIRNGNEVWVKADASLDFESWWDTVSAWWNDLSWSMGLDFGLSETVDSSLVAAGYAVKVRVTDAAGQYVENDVILKLHDESDALSLEGAFTISESAAGGSDVGQVTLSGATQDQPIQFSLLDNANAMFEIDGTGMLRLGSSAALDFESSDVHWVHVLATQGTNSTEKWIKVGVQDENDAPIAIEINGDVSMSTMAAVAEFQGGAEIASVYVIDPDRGNTAFSRYSFEIGGDYWYMFEIVDGVLKLRDDYALTADMGPVTLTITAINEALPNSAEHTISSLISIDIVDVDYAPFDIILWDDTPVGEGSTLGHIWEIAATDPLGTNTTWSIVNDDGSFLLFPGGAPGHVQLWSLVSMNFESSPFYDVTIRASNGDGYRDQTLRLWIEDDNDAPTGVMVEVAEIGNMDPAGTVMATFTAIDEDWGDTHTFVVSPNGYAPFTPLVVGNKLVMPEGVYIEPGSYSFRVYAVDADGATSEWQPTEFSISVQNTNQAPTEIVFSGNASISEGFYDAMTYLGSFSAVDDAPYLILWQLDSATGNFFLNTNGDLYFSMPSYFDADYVNHLDLHVSALDLGNGLSVGKDIRIDIQNLPDPMPVAGFDDINIGVLEDHWINLGWVLQPYGMYIDDQLTLEIDGFTKVNTPASSGSLTVDLSGDKVIFHGAGYEIMNALSETFISSATNSSDDYTLDFSLSSDAWGVIDTAHVNVEVGGETDPIFGNFFQTAFGVYSGEDNHGLLHFPELNISFQDNDGSERITSARLDWLGGNYSYSGGAYSEVYTVHNDASNTWSTYLQFSGSTDQVIAALDTLTLAWNGVKSGVGFEIFHTDMDGGEMMRNYGYISF